MELQNKPPDTDIKEISVSKFLRDLPISSEDKNTLLLCIAAIQKETGEEAAKLTTAACMGMSPDDPLFNVFYNRDIAPIINLDVQKLYNQLRPLLYEEDEQNSKEE